ncbi:MAG: HTH domain-containing protein [Schwartzia sp.]|nr:HTH domain-containing protein [Schwartzia sp. (in: firmicutes)]
MRSKNPALMERIKNFAEEYCMGHLGKTPSTREIARHVGVSNVTVHRYIHAMKEQGMISYEDGEIITEKTRKFSTDQIGMPIAGCIPCGLPEANEEYIDEYVFLPQTFLGNGEFFILRASGESMVDAGIDDGDMVVIRKQYDVPRWKIVAATIDGGSTLKRLCYDNDRKEYYLHPENSEIDFPDIRGNFEVQGVAVYVLKEL